MSDWIGVDLDGTLARNDVDGWLENIGPPVERMVVRVRNWLAQGKNVKIMTARVSSKNFDARKHRSLIEQWCVEHIGTMLPITSEKDSDMTELWDDRAISVEENTGRYVRFKENGEIKHR
jgi:hypothetical protein